MPWLGTIQLRGAVRSAPMKLKQFKPSLRVHTPRPLTKLAPTPRIGATERIEGRARVERNHRFLSEHPLCVHCLAKGVYTAAREADHITPLWDGGEDTIANLQGLCVPCHAIKTRAEAGRRAAGGRGQTQS